jgi:hypothetical protein
MKLKSAYFLSHNGLGDNITNIGAVNFLLEYYESIYFLCKDIYEENVKLLFVGMPVYTVVFSPHNEFSECLHILSNVNKQESDIFVSGLHTNYASSHITHPELLKYKQQQKYQINYSHINDFYTQIGLDTSIYVDYFNINSSKESLQYYNEIRDYKIVFVHTKGSNRSINVDDVLSKYKSNDEYIIISADGINVYSHDTADSPKYAICERFKNMKISHYIDIIKHAEIIHVVNSCFSCIIYPMLLAKSIHPIECKIHEA